MARWSDDEFTQQVLSRSPLDWLKAFLTVIAAWAYVYLCITLGHAMGMK